MRSVARPTDRSTKLFAAWRRTCSESALVTRDSSSATARGARFLRRNSANSTAAAALAKACGDPLPADQDLLPTPERLEWEMAKADGRHSTELPPGLYGCTVAVKLEGEGGVVGDGRVNQSF